MKVNFSYDKSKDIWCLINYGKSSYNSKMPTKVYEQMVAEYGEDIDEAKCSQFIDNYLRENNIDIESYISNYQNDWDRISETFHKRAEEIFGVPLPNSIDVFLSLNNRSPYSIDNNFFFVAVPTISSIRTAMHELWHFYTWHKYGKEWEVKIGKQRYNDIKEALTVLLNVEFGSLFDGEDKGYPQHTELRKRILQIWGEERNMDKLWERLVIEGDERKIPHPAKLQ